MMSNSGAKWERPTQKIAAAITLVGFPLLVALVYLLGPDWYYQPDVRAPLTRNLLYFHPPTAWASFVAYGVVFVYSVAYLNERKLAYDAPAYAAASVGFMLNTVALITGTLWGIQEWTRQGQSALATVYTEPKVMVVVVMWLIFAAYLLLRRSIDIPTQTARLSAVFGVLGFIAVPISFMTSRVLRTSLHPDIAGPGANPDAAVGDTVGSLLLLGAVVFIAAFVWLWLWRLQTVRQENHLAQLEEELHGE